MYRTFVRFFAPVVLVFCLVPMIAAGQRRSFSGTYQLSNVKQSDDSIQVTVTLTLRNYSGADIHGGNVVLLDSSANPIVLGKFTSVKLLESGHAQQMSHAFSISREEYALWQEGRNPVLRFQQAESTDPQSAEGIDLQRVSSVSPATN